MLLHKGGDTSDRPSDWRPIGLLEVDLDQLKLDWITSEAQRLKQRIIRIDIDFKNAFISMSQSALWAVMRAYNLPDIDLLEAIYSRTTACMDPEDARCATITFLTGVIQGGASSPRISVVFINALLEHLTCTGQALGISHGIAETEQFNTVAFMDDITALVQDNAGAQILLNATQEFEAWSNTRLNLSKTVVIDIDGGSGEVDPPHLTYNQQAVKIFQATESCRHLVFWETPNGNMAVIKHRVARENERGIRAPYASPPGNKDSQGTLPEHGGKCVSLLSGSGAMEPSRTRPTPGIMGSILQGHPSTCIIS
jgi:hypothetical protein